MLGTTQGIAAKEQQKSYKMKSLDIHEVTKNKYMQIINKYFKNIYLTIF